MIPYELPHRDVGAKQLLLQHVFHFIQKHMQVLTAMLWGNLANKQGTKPLIQISQLSAIAANLALAFAPTYVFALVARFLSGLFNSITGAMKTNAARSFDVKHQVQPSHSLPHSQGESQQTICCCAEACMCLFYKSSVYKPESAK